MADQQELLAFDAVGLSALIRSGELHPGEVLDATITRIEEFDGTLNAVIDKAFDRARSKLEDVAPDAPFAGIPTFVKDLIDVEGLRRSEGSRLQMGNISPASPDYILKMEQAGLIISGKTNTPEFASLPVTDNADAVALTKTLGRYQMTIREAEHAYDDIKIERPEPLDFR